MSFWAYMLHCRGGVFYVGHTDNLEARIAEHHAGKSAYTRQYLPLELVWSQDFPTRLEALETERRIKGWSRAKKLALVRGDWAAISVLAASKNGPSTSSGRTGEGNTP
ncbi:GIY-YIG nuclease family protein [Sphingomonas cannabina]|uniref:GIY-YIG nuclease family protein n=1 Tax=Sphingomonas cannabina TaxID=2899123 RepID=UPI001F2BADC4|nr:GIY-YIG nuclease family protein [Sphingomonas cannabina]UIJ45766.1 GIY-YIG nuclease family protein [Sphingomonas cannabina]